ncbi:hypothetical protein [Paraburkholderia lacunae]|uniref:Lipoprotein n=1 Tax=Paraburkholderia lacunae TaxID=2211104 RepID=A0A370N6F4_9BURK|nr:hypothetical protein [Paraburkholderia lacunae]RDK01181.1 hypothetical protein DLM46_17785 [Paraburkholderia lacunae]
MREFLALAGTVALSFVLTACDRRPAPDTASTATAPAALTATAPETTAEAKDPLALPAGDLDDETIANYLYAAMDFKRPDEFSKGFNDAALVGRHFEIEIPSDKPGKRGPTYYYDPDKEQLTLIVRPAYGSYEGGDNSLDYLTFVQETSYGAPKLASNAFKVTKEVTPVSYRVIGIGAVAGTYMGVFPKDSLSTKETIIYRDLTKTLKLDPRAAKTAVEGLTMKVEGTVAKDGNGHSITCKTSTRGATLDHLYEESWHQCVLSAKLSRITVSSPNAGVLAQWGASRRAEGKKGEKTSKTVSTTG